MDDLVSNHGDIYETGNRSFRLVAWNNGFAKFEEFVVDDNEKIVVIAEHVISTENGCSELDEL